MLTFTAAKQQFDVLHQSAATTDCVVPVDGKLHSAISIRDVSGARSEEYYKWQFIAALINSGLYAKDYIGVEVRFPKGSKTSAQARFRDF
jgi:type I restriction enzyme M protein